MTIEVELEKMTETLSTHRNHIEPKKHPRETAYEIPGRTVGKGA
jgi:hypothetical protein